MDIGFLWDETKYRKVLSEHGVRFHEVVSALDDPDGFEVPDPAGHPDRWMWLGQTAQGRLLIVIYSDEELPLYRLITAFEPDEGWSQEYERYRRI
jgi:uncharacterized DUF497 family protein